MAGTAKDGDKVRVHYTGRLDSGEVFDSSHIHGEPMEFTVGSGEVIQGFDDAVRGMEVGDKKMVKIPSSEAYGERNDDYVQEVPRQGMNLDVEPQVGMSLTMHLPDGNQIPVSITDVTATHITLDANHPPAGQDLTFEVELMENDPQEG